MSYKEALEDGIKFTKNKYGDPMYLVPCHICGATVPSLSYLRDKKYTCPDCRQYMVEAKLNVKTDVKKKKLDVAIKRIAKVADIEEYKDAIDHVSKQLSKPGWFQSTEEIMVALELAKNHVEAYTQVKIYNYSVDFVLPQYKVALEIDGPNHNGKDESIRDELIVDKLGEGYELIRIKVDFINMNITKLMNAIYAVKYKRRRDKWLEKVYSNDQDSSKK